MAESLRDQLEASYDKIVDGKDETPAPETPAETQVAPATPATGEEKPGRTAGRARDEKGRLLPGPAAKPEEKPSETVVAAPVASEVKRPQRPSSWKKEMWGHWDTIPQDLAEYLLEREGQFAKGVSTYKQEWERAKPLVDVVAPHLELFKQHGIDPAQQIAKYIELHRGFALGTPEQKLGMLLRVAQDYQIPVQNLFVQGQDGKLYFNPQIQPHQPNQSQQGQQQQPTQASQDMRTQLQEMLAEERAAQEAKAMEADTARYPHFAEVKETMRGLLLGGLAQDLNGAYDAALRMPQHAQIWDAIQEQKRKSDEAKKLDEQRKAAEAARRNIVSPRTATPASTAPKSTKGLRGALESAYDEHVTGRV